MKNILLSTAALVGLTAGAMAADLPVRAAPPAPVVAAVPVFTWTGFYVGVNGGVAFQEHDNDRRAFRDRDRDRDGRRARHRGNGGDDSSILGGGQIGYNMQFGLFVAGVEADIQAINFDRINPRLDGRRDRDRDRDRNLFDDRGGDDVNAFGTVRGRLGLAAFDRGLLYATGGLAWKSDEDNGGRHRGGGSDNIGYTVGGGFEYAFTNNLSLKIEGLYVDFSEDNDRNGNRRRHVGPVNFGGHDGREFGLVRAGLNFRFNSF